MSTWKSSRRRAGTIRVASIACALLLTACVGDDGRQGPAGPTGPQGPDGPPGELDPNLTTWEKAVAGIGGEQALESLTSFTVTASGVYRVVGQGPYPGAPAAPSSERDVTIHVDIDRDRMRIDSVRNILFIPGVELTNSEIYAGQLGHVQGNDSLFGPAAATGDMPSARWSSGRKLQMLLNPQLLLKKVLADPSAAATAGVALHNGTIHELLVIADAVHPITLWINASTGRVAKLTTMVNDHLLRDARLEIHYHGWQNRNTGIAFPRDVYLIFNDEILVEEYRSEVMANPDLSDDLFTFPEGAAPTYVADDASWGETSFFFHQQLVSMGIPLDWKQTYVQASELSPGVWFLGGGSHNSLVVEQQEGVVVIEPPLYPARSVAILDWIAAEPSLGGKPVTHVVLTHHHSDHAGGLREFVAAGARPVVSERIIPFVDKILAAPSTVSPDTLAMSPINVDIIGVPDQLLTTLDDATNPIDVYHVPNFHAGDMVFIHLPSGNYLFQSDLWNPGNGGVSLAPALAQLVVDGIDDLGITVETLVGGHGTWGPLSELHTYLGL